MATKLYVGNLAESTTEKSLRELFDAFGSVSEVAVLQGYGFVVSYTHVKKLSWMKTQIIHRLSYCL